MTFEHRPARQPGSTSPSAGRRPAASGSGPRWRHRVRWMTAGVAGAAGAGVIALTVGLAQAAVPSASADPVDDPAAGPAPSTAATGAPLTRPDTAPRTAVSTPSAGAAPTTRAPSSTPSTAAPSTAAPSTAARSTAAPAITAPPTLAPPVRTPAAGSGGSHARSGGS